MFFGRKRKVSVPIWTVFAFPSSNQVYVPATLVGEELLCMGSGGPKLCLDLVHVWLLKIAVTSHSEIKVGDQTPCINSLIGRRGGAQTLM